MTHPLSLFTSTVASMVTMPRGLFSRGRAHQPEQALALYEFENCPHCRVVREALTQLDLEATIYPCPKGGERFRTEVIAMGGKAQFPYLVDHNTGDRLYESTAIIRHLYVHYGYHLPSALRIALLAKPPSIIASAARNGGGMRVSASRAPDQLLDLWSFEASPFARLVRERLCELELPYRLHNVAKTRAVDLLPPALRSIWLADYVPESANRKALLERTGAVQVPYLYDANTDTGLFESAEIIRYLDKTYAL
ncbi:MAG: glutathione S-transferase N-terminal domain-containing protein [Pseudomonadota bacterium]